uniref:RRM domain-containing protein n=1 Tax=Romanomermis culicivorax TaxID=13658 RepID=A0A915L9S6_ROMCU
MEDFMSTLATAVTKTTIHRSSTFDCPAPSRCLGVFGMNINTTESTLAHYFQPFGKVEKIQIVYDAKTGRSRGFGFIYFDNVQDAIEVKFILKYGTLISGAANNGLTLLAQKNFISAQ